MSSTHPPTYFWLHSWSDFFPCHLKQSTVHPLVDCRTIGFFFLSFGTIYQSQPNHPPTHKLKSFDQLILWQALHRIGWVETHSHAKHIAVLWKYHLYLSCITLNINKIPTSKEVESAELLSFKDKEQLTSRCAPLSPVVPVQQLADSFIASSGVPYQCS